MRLFADEVAEGYQRDGWWSGRTWSERLDEHCRERPDVLALVDAPNRLSFTTGAPRRLTWAEVGIEVERLARVLFAHGVSAGTVVGVQLPNVVELPMIYLAVAQLGGIVTPFPVQYRSHELERMGAAAGMQVFVTASEAVSRPLAAEAAALDVPTLRHVLAFGDRAGEGFELIDQHLAAQHPDPSFDEYM
ncbi:MAG: AMP-binding protein, partial [Rhodococcus sp. (in: high G+C Gram-positive bacteria)]|uniref:AMP-binding protein n=1 Tax=Rhodococcus sp. TaxID=1831 RepID=UPI003BAE322D